MHQIKMRAERIGTFEEEMLLYCETDLDAITNAILKTKPEFAVIDSIQTMYSEDLSSAAGSVSSGKRSNCSDDESCERE